MIVVPATDQRPLLIDRPDGGNITLVDRVIEAALSYQISHVAVPVADVEQLLGFRLILELQIRHVQLVRARIPLDVGTCAPVVGKLQAKFTCNRGTRAAFNLARLAQQRNTTIFEILYLTYTRAGFFLA